MPLPRISRYRVSKWLFGLAIFLSASLTFLLEPMAAKSVLPQFGGAPMVWNTCLLFFQATLFAGYAYSHTAITILGRRRHALVYAVLGVTACASLPFALQTDLVTPSVTHPTRSLLTLLFTSIGFPFFVLSASAPTLQSSFAAINAAKREDPYFLYAVSNVGSLVSLLAYPLILEPNLPASAQRVLLAIGYLVFAGTVFCCAALTWRYGERPSEPESSSGGSLKHSVGWPQRLKWTMLAFVPSSLLLGVTSYLSTDIAAFPLLWVIPLALYLATFVIAFAPRADSWGGIAGRALPIVMAALAVFMVGIATATWLLLLLHLASFTMAALMCHGQLATDRPQSAHLTGFYLCVALGGLLGGAFNTFIAPLIFSNITEYPLMLVAACALRVIAAPPPTPQRCDSRFERLIPIVVGPLTALIVFVLPRLGVDARGIAAAVGLPAVLAFSQSRRPIRFAASIGAILLAASLAESSYGRVLQTHRTFFGVYRVSAEQSNRFHALFHGTTLHGLQAVSQDRQGEPLTYYHRAGPIGQAFGTLPQLSSIGQIATVGLGVGSLAAYARPGQQWTFYEIDPAVERIARNEAYFTYLRTCGDQCRVVLGDARISLAHAPLGTYAAIILDAFSSDAIPLHLLTREALLLYLSRLSSDGVLAFHISNRHLAIRPVLARLAESAGLTAVGQAHEVTKEEAALGARSSEWLVMAREHDTVESLLSDGRWSLATTSRSTPLWTDDFSNVISALNLR